jgi:hypothetical protein
MRTGLLWFDGSTSRTAQDKIAAAVKRYHNKFGVQPNACYVNSDLLTVETVEVQGLHIIGAANVLPHHFFLGVSES